jgi:hypothetical protein
VRSSKKRLRHFETTWQGRSRREATSSLARPLAAYNTIFALITSRSGDEYLAAVRSRASRSAFDSLIA